jgi:hypothetical protein
VFVDYWVRLAGINLCYFYASGNLDAINTINLLANGSPVLFAVDYQRVIAENGSRASALRIN